MSAIQTLEIALKKARRSSVNFIVGLSAWPTP